MFGNLFCALPKGKGDVDAELEPAAIVTTDVKCIATFQEASSGMLGGMTKEVSQTDSTVLVDENLGDGLEKCIDVPIQHDLDMDDDTPVGEKTCGDELVLGALQWTDSQLVSDNLDIALVGSQHLDTVIREIAQPPSGRYGLRKSMRRRGKKTQQLAKVTKEDIKTPFRNTLIYKEPDGTKHIMPFESFLDVSWRLQHGSRVRRLREHDASCIVLFFK